MRRYKKNKYLYRYTPLFFYNFAEIFKNTMKEKEDIVFSRNSVEFVTVAAEFCAYLEKSGEQPRKDFVETLLKLLPLLYIKAQMLPEEEPITDETLEHFVTEDSYEVLRMTIFDILADKDAYLDVFVSDMKYSDTPVTKSISEDLADYGVELRLFMVNSISADDTDPSVIQLKKALAKKAEMDIIGYSDVQERSFDALQTAAGNEGNAGAMMGAGMGLGMGVGVGSPMGNAMAAIAKEISPSNARHCINCGVAVPPGARFCPGCGTKID